MLAALDDDPTGSQSVHGVELVTGLERDRYDAALRHGGGTCFVLTNTRSLDEPAAAGLTAQVARDLLEVAADRGRRLQLVSRSDSTLRGHVIAEIDALQSVRPGYDGVLFAPAYLEAGRVTAGDVHWARVGGEFVPVGETEFARDATFGYSSSNLTEFLAAKSGGRVGARSLSLGDIRDGGPGRVRDVLAGVSGGQWVIVNATEYSDLETVALGVLEAEAAGQAFLFRTGPSFVRALAGIEPSEPLTSAQIWPAGPPAGHGLIVVGSHVGQTTRQLAALRARGRTVDVELDVPALLAGSGAGDSVAGAVISEVTRGLAAADVLLYTSRTLQAGADATASLAIARTVSAALVRIAAGALAARPAWVISKGGITSHDVALHGLGIRRAEVLGQLLPGVVSVLRPVDAPAAVVGVPYVVFAGNVGDRDTLAQVVDTLRGEAS
ncbi:MAG TPA: four-carbon acid sugar kinase family protein [Trebonia sp.]